MLFCLSMLVWLMDTTRSIRFSTMYSNSSFESNASVICTPKSFTSYKFFYSKTSLKVYNFKWTIQKWGLQFVLCDFRLDDLFEEICQSPKKREQSKGKCNFTWILCHFTSEKTVDVGVFDQALQFWGEDKKPKWKRVWIKSDLLRNALPK